MNEETPELVIPVVAEELHIDATRVKTGGVRVSKRLVTEIQQLHHELQRTTAKVERIIVEREVDGPIEPYREGSTLVIPLVEEVVTIQRKWVVREELRIHQTAETNPVDLEIPLSHEEAIVERVDPSGKIVDTR